MRLAAMAARNIHQRVLARVVCAPVDKFFDVTPVGEITNRFAKDMDVVDATLPDFMMQLLQNALRGIETDNFELPLYSRQV